MGERRCYRESYAASKDSTKTANCALSRTVLFLQAQRLGLVVLTANVSDYDILLQLIPTGQVLFYRHNEAIPNLLGLSLCPVVHSMWWKLRDGLF